MGDILSVLIERQDVLYILRRELVVARDLDALLAGVDKEDGVVAFGLFEHHDGGGNAGAKKEIIRQLNNAIDKVIVDQILPDLLLSAAAIQDPREADDRRRAAGRQPAQAVHHKSHVGFAFGRQNARRSKTGIVDHHRAVRAHPLCRIGRIGNDRLKRLKVFELWIGQGVAVGDVKIAVTDIVQEHIDAAKAVDRQVDLLTKETLAHVLGTQDLTEFKQETARTLSCQVCDKKYFRNNM